MATLRVTLAEEPAEVLAYLVNRYPDSCWPSELDLVFGFRCAPDLKLLSDMGLIWFGAGFKATQDGIALIERSRAASEETEG